MYILDSSALLPVLLVTHERPKKLVVPHDVTIEATRNRRSWQYAKLGDVLAKLDPPTGNARIASLPEKLQREPRFLQAIDRVDLSVIRTALQEREKGNDVCIVTRDRELRTLALQENVWSITPSGFRKLRRSDATDEKLSKLGPRSVWLSLILAIFLVILALTIVVSIAAGFGFVVSNGNHAVLAAAIPGVGLLLYMIRGRFIGLYGAVEIIAGALGAYAILWSFNGMPYDGVAFVHLDVAAQQEYSKIAISILFSLYVIVRGLDNIGKSLVGTWWEHRWRILSGE